MQVLIVSATPHELAPFRAKYGNREWLPGQHHLRMAETGVGLVSATYQLTRMLRENRPELIVQAGIAGSFSPDFPPGSVALVKREKIADEGVEESGTFRDLFDLGLLRPDNRPFRNRWLENPYLSQFSLPGFRQVDAVSVNEISTRQHRIAIFQNPGEPVFESMEGAAFHYVGLMENIPFLQIRAVSNFVGERNKANWNMAEAISNLNTALALLLENIIAPSNTRT